MRSQINKVLKKLIKREDVLILGQSIKDPFGGAAKVTRGIKSDQVINLPISEAGSMGFCTGLAMAGFKPILEIMFADFLTLICDQVVNIFANVPEDLTVVIRTMQGPESYGPTHSKDMLWIIAEWPIWCDYFEDPEDIPKALDKKGITVLIEEKEKYDRQSSGIVV